VAQFDMKIVLEAYFHIKSCTNARNDGDIRVKVYDSVYFCDTL